MLKLTDNNLVAHQSGEKKTKNKNLPCLKRKDIFSLVLVRKQKMELTVTSGFINNPPVSHVCKPRDKKLPSWHKLRNTAHVCDQNGHSRWTPAPFMAFIDVKEQFKKSTACCLPTRLLNMQSHGWTRRIWVFSRKEKAPPPFISSFPPYLECRCMARHSSRRLHTGTQCSQCGTNNQQVTAEASPPLT